MKIIKSKSYMKKEAIWSNMPIGDPGLPGQLTEQDIVGGPEEDIGINISGELVVDEGKIYYRYDYDYNENEATNIRPIIDSYDWEFLIDKYKDQIISDIEIAEESSKLEKQPGYGQPEYDPVDQYDDIGF